ncbi:putative metallopeptidase [Bacillus subtilis]|uniref:putative metallopeptidase n=1 Tax=Bacillus subtilis TaxID=1423 RepID=UPI0013E93EA9|nr:putative metallopeptidase [Bacillus subtilis]
MSFAILLEKNGKSQIRKIKVSGTVYGAATDPDSWGIREHDVEEFSEIIERHGLWDTGIETFAEAVREADHQMSISDVQRLSRVK